MSFFMSANNGGENGVGEIEENDSTIMQARLGLHGIVLFLDRKCFFGPLTPLSGRFLRLMQLQGQKCARAIRTSIGLASNDAGVGRFVHFVEGIRELIRVTIGEMSFDIDSWRVIRDGIKARVREKACGYRQSPLYLSRLPPLIGKPNEL